MGVQEVAAQKFLWSGPLDVWELAWAPYDQQTYNFVLELIQTEDRVLDIGAGDLRLALRMASRAREVYACEIQERLIQMGVRNAGISFPENLHIIHGDARYVQFPLNLTLAVLLIRHCRHFWLYTQKLIQNGCFRLITNARWRMGVEFIDLSTPRVPYDELVVGWYACICGATGFKTGCLETKPVDMMEQVIEVMNCPECPNNGNGQ